MNDSTPKLLTLGHLIGELARDNELAVQAKLDGKPRGPITGLPELDEALGGCLAPGLHIIQAAPGVGKTALALQIAGRCQFPALFTTAEMPPLELFRRVIAQSTKTFLGKLKSGEMATETIIRLAQTTAGSHPYLAFLDGTQAWASPQIIRERAELVRDQAKSQQILVVVDSLQFWAKGGSEGSLEYDAVNAALKSLAQVARDLASPFFAISHRNRQGNKAGGGLHASKGSGDVEYAAESLIDIERAGNSPDARGKFSVILNLHKNRHGTAGIEIPLQFDGAIQTFFEK